MSDLLSTGVSALLAYQTALNTTSHNIANANTAGYSRQRVDLSTALGSGSGAGYVGNGVQVQSVSRISDAATLTRLQSYTSSQSRASTYANYATRLDGVLSDSSLNLSTPMQAFFSAASGVASNPTSSSARQALLSAGQTLASRFNTVQSQLDGVAGEVNQSLTATVGEINQYTSQLAKLNTQIVDAQSQFGGQPPNDLLDQRDQLVQTISSRIGVRAETQADGSVNLFTSAGQALVLSNQATALGTAPDSFGSGDVDVTYNGKPITSQLSGGTLGGLLDTRRELIEPARNEVGRLAAALASAVNAQNAAGTNQNGTAGTALFTTASSTASPSASNSGSASVAVAISDAGALGTSNYVIKFDGNNWSARDSRSGASVALTGSGTSADPLKLGGVALTVSGSAQAGDQFLVQPTANAAGQLAMATSDPRAIAAAAAGAAANSSDNSNAQKLAGLSTQGVLNGGADSVMAAQTSLVARVGAQAQQASTQLDAQTALQSQAQSSWESTSGVNLDEEAADLIRYQQAYQAAAHVIQIANDVFQSLLQAAKG